MRVGIDATSVLDELSGVEVHILTVVDALSRHPVSGEEIVLFVRRQPPPTWNSLPDSFRVVSLPTSSQALATQVLLPAAASRAHLDLLHCPAKPPPAASTVRVVAGLNDAVPWTRPDTMGAGAARWYRWFSTVAVSRGAHATTLSEASASSIRAVFPRLGDRLHVTGASLAPWLREAATAGAHCRPGIGSGPYVLSLCRIEPRKDLATVLDAWDLARDELEGYRLVLAGRPAWKVGSVIDRARSTPGVTLLGSVDNADLPGLYAHASAFVSASREEGFGLPLLEAMAFGAPVVATSIPAHVEVAGPALRPFSVGDAAGLAERLLEATHEQAGASRTIGLAQAAQWSDRRLAERVRGAWQAAAA